MLAFHDCKLLDNIVIPSSVTSIDKNTFDGCSNLKNVEVSKDNTIYKSENNCIIEIATGEVIFDPDSH